MAGQATGKAPAIDAFYDSVDRGSSNGYMIFSVAGTDNIRFDLADPAFAPYSGGAKVLNAVTWISTAGVAGDLDLVTFYDSDGVECYTFDTIGLVSSGNAFVVPKLEWATAGEEASISSGTVA